MLDVALALLLVLRRRGVTPPVDHVPFGVELHPRSVEAVRDFVADDGADGAVVHVRRRLDVEERRFEDAGGELDAVLGQVVEGVDDGGVDVVPLLALSRVAEETRRCKGKERKKNQPVTQRLEMVIDPLALLWYFLLVDVMEAGQRPRREPEGMKSCRIQGESVHLSICLSDCPSLKGPPGPMPKKQLSPLMFKIPFWLVMIPTFLFLQSTTPKTQNQKRMHNNKFWISAK